MNIKLKFVLKSPINMAENKLQENQNYFILKLGGSVFSNNGKIIDFEYLREFRDMLREQVLLNRKFVLILGGGENTISFIKHAEEKGGISNTEDLHWIGTAMNTVNAYMVRAFLGDEITDKHVWKFDDKDKLDKINLEEKPIAVVGGFEAGKSGDWCALQVAKAIGCKVVFDLKNVDGVYTKDPKKHDDAEFIPELNWKDYLDLMGNPEEHVPGGILPVDVFAARESEELGVTYYVLSALDFDNIERALGKEEFKGTMLKPTKP
jgi:uridylate kinase